MRSDGELEDDTCDQASSFLPFLSALEIGGGDDTLTEHTLSDPLPHPCNSKETDPSPESEFERLSSIRYDRHKPKWWKQRVGRYVTKPQRRALEAMQAYRLAKPAYGSVLDFASLFGREEPPPRMWLELGFGKGDNLLCLAQRHPGDGFVGVEVHPSSAAICLQRMQSALERQQAWVGYQLYSPCLDPFSAEFQSAASGGAVVSAEWGASVDPASPHPLENVRIYGGDGIVLLESGVASDSFDAILVTFPDPFPTDPPHRILQVHTVDTMYKRLRKPGGRLYLATDHAGFFAWALQVVDAWNQRVGSGARTDAQQPQQQASDRLVGVEVERCEWLPVISRYERKGWDGGRRTLLRCWEARAAAD